MLHKFLPVLLLSSHVTGLFDNLADLFGSDENTRRYFEIKQRWASNPWGIQEGSLIEGRSNVCKFEYQYSVKYKTKCGWQGWRRCTRYRDEILPMLYCCDGWSPYYDSLTSCSRAVCDNKIRGTCTKTYSDDYIQYRTGQIQRVSGGSCTAPDTCTGCNDGFYSNGPYCTICPKIQQCLHRKCTSTSDNICEYCEGEVKPKQYWRAYTNHLTSKTSCIKTCSWRASSTRCFPGVCADESESSCTCTSGFTGYQCDQITTTPSILYNEAELKQNLGASDETLLNPADPNGDDTQDKVWSNNPDWEQIKVKWNAKYEVQIPTPGGEHYVTDFKHGIILAKTTVLHQRSGATIGTIQKTYPGISRFAPINTMNTEETFVFADHSLSTPFQHQDMIKFTVQVDLGGVGFYTDRETNTNNQWVLSGTTLSREFIYHFDLVPPYHCLDCEELFNTTDITNESHSSMEKNSDFLKFYPEPGDLVNILLTGSTTIEISWGNGWIDDLSGLSYFEYELYELGHDGTNLVENPANKPIGPVKVNSGKSASFEVPNPGAFSVHLIAYDFAGNYVPARRIFLFDDQSSVNIVGSGLKSPTASKETNFVWVTQDVSNIRVDWTDNFENIRHYNGRWLGAVKPSSVIPDSRYDDHTGDRTVAAIDNVKERTVDLGPVFHNEMWTGPIMKNRLRSWSVCNTYKLAGIVKFSYLYGVYDKTGEKSSTPDTETANIHVQYQDLPVDWEDGDKMIATVTAYDIFQESNSGSITLYRDTTQPVIENLWITRGDRLNVSVHRIEDFQEMTVEWSVYDYHSGIDTIYWRLYDNFTGADVLHGREDISAQGSNEDVSTCDTKYGAEPRNATSYCTPFWGCHCPHYQIQLAVKGDAQNPNGLIPTFENGVHDSEYFFEVSATNKAGLTTTHSTKITVDVSPPHKGVVYDGMRGTPEVDYQQSTSLTAHWGGFFDRESGVLFYQYGFDTSCIDKSMFTLNGNNAMIHETYSLDASFTAPGEGEYHITVVAYNRALEPSEPVCSDGVFVTTDVPGVKEVTVEPSRVLGGLVTNQDQSAYYVLGSDRVRRLISSPTAECGSKATIMSDIDLLPLMRNSDDSVVEVNGSIVCKNTSSAPSEIRNVLSRSSRLYIAWTALDNTGGIYDYEVGLATTSASSAPDILAFRSTKQHAHIDIHHADIPDGTLFYIIIKSISKASVENMQTVGPCIMDNTPPDFTGPISLTYSDGYLYAVWASDAFVDAQDDSGLKMQFAIGHAPKSTDVYEYQDLQSSGPCDAFNPPNCTAIKVEDTDWSLHGHHTYYLTIKAENLAGLTTYAVSDAYIHDVQLPSRGKVFDIMPGETAVDKLIDIEDIDFQVSTIEISARWTGFAHPHLTVTYRFSIGTTTGGTDIVSEVDVGVDTSHTETGLALSAFTTYYVTIKAQTSAGHVEMSSDGVSVVEEGYAIQGIDVYDGENCTMDPRENFGHHDEDNRMPCSADIDYQISQNSLKAYWTVPSNLIKFTPDVHFAIEEKSSTSVVWTIIREYEHISSHTFARVNDLFLKGGYFYRFSIKFCAVLYCYAPVKSDGVLILAFPPQSGSLIVKHLNKAQGSGGKEQLEVEMQRFYDPNIADSVLKYSVIEKYEWAITDQSAFGRTHTKWTKLTDVTLTKGGAHQTFTIDLPGEFDFSKCRSISVRGINKARLVSQVTAQVKDCAAFDPLLVVPNHVIDAVGTTTSTDGLGNPIFLEENALWPLSDRDYTPYYNYISAVWPRLRYKTYKVAVIHYKTMDITTYYKPVTTLDLNDPCSHPDALACKDTSSEYHNFKFDDGALKHGERYIICLHADRTEIKHEKWTEILPDLNTCSDGVIVDLTPPVAGDVWITSIPGTKFQTSTRHMYINWDSFRDVEELNKLAHSSGIQEYTLGIGTSAGKDDVIEFYSVGVVNHVALNNLNLQSGQIYYATIIAKDYANRTTTKTSDPVVIDTTPPVKQDVGITIPQRHLVSKSEIRACWTNVFKDLESGISYYEWSVGSEPGYDDMLTYTRVTDECASNEINNPLDLQEGHAYFISVKAHNNAGLMSMATSWAFVVDTSPPVAGHVYDGMSSNPTGRKDVDYQTDMSYLSAFWEGFHDPHTAIQEYYVSIGSCQGCMDVLENQAIGLTTEFRLTEAHFAAGLTYYTTVKACNTADMCTSVTSDGVIMDNSPPTMGVVYDGTASNDIEYQSIQTYIGAKWFGFVDPQSDMLKYQWRAGTTPGGADILSATDVHLTDVVAKTDLGSPLPSGTRIYITVRGYNRAGLYTDAISDGFVIDTTPPIITSGPVFSSVFSATGHTSFYRNTIKVEWSVEDEQSYIERQYLSVKSHRGGMFNLASVSLNGLSRDFILTGLDCHDGVTYYVQLISCNGAQVCSTATSTGLLVDTTPPSRGMFAINTDHAVSHELQRQSDDNWMTWSTFAVNLAWLGFADLHSEIDYYMVYVGSSFMTTDLNKEQGQGQRVTHTTNGADRYDEGKVQTVTIETQKLTPYSDLYITIYAVNKVGLRSELIHSQFERVPGGTLSLKRRCTAITCLGHCVCAPQDQLCDPSDTPDCTDLSSANPNNLLSVNDVLDGEVDIDYTASNTVLRGTWSIGIRQGTSPLWYQWSVGVTSNSKPEGVFDPTQNVWRHAGNNLDAIFTHTQGSTLTDSRLYSMFVRAWYSTSTYAIFKSDGVRISLEPPRSITNLGSAVTERTSNKVIKDEDSIRHGYPITISWQNKFTQAENVIAFFKVYLSTYPGGHNVFNATESLTVSTTSYEVRGTRSFVPGVKYYSNVIGYGLSGMHLTESSDGYRPDKSPPQAGIVFDGIGLHDLEYQNSTEIVEANWHGFTDTLSGITSYYWCVGLTTAADECNIRTWEKIGLHTSVARKLDTNIAQGTKIYNKVYAEDYVGYTSTVVLSDGVYVDTTTPVAQYLLHMGDNLLQNPSFENSVRVISTTNINATNVCKLTPDYHPGDWEVATDSCVATVYSSNNLAQDGQNFVFIRGGLRQTLTGLSSGTLYRLQFYSSHILMSSSVIANKEGFVKFGDENSIFIMYNKAYRSDNQDSSDRNTVSWHKHTFYYEPMETEVNLTIGAVDDGSGIFIDHMTFEKVQRDTLMSDGDQVSVHVVYLHDWGSIHSAWSFVEDASHVVEYTWAIGYSVGGTQVQGFRSVGTSLSAYNSSVVLVHNSTIYVTVIARNIVDLQSIIYSDPILVDLTAPEFTGVYDGRIIGEDEDAQTENEISVNWEVQDPESGIEYCEWSIGTQANGMELRGFQRAKDGSILEYADLDFKVLKDKIIYVTVRCKNRAGLMSSRSSDGVRVSDVKTLIDNAVVTPIPQSVTEYRPQDNFQSNTTNIRLKWSGFSDNIPIELYEISVNGLDMQLSEKTNFPAKQDVKYTDITKLNLLPERKEIDIVAINDFFLKSEKLKTNLTVFVDKPTVDDSETLAISWNTPNTRFTVSWDNIFTSPHPLYYEVSAGRVKGGGEIVQWLETNSTSVTFGLPKSVTKWSNMDVYIMVRAIAAGGRYDDVHGKIKLPSAK